MNREHLISKYFKSDPRILVSYPDADWISFDGDPMGKIQREFSECNQKILSHTVLLSKPKTVVEIGVSRPTNIYEQTSTKVFLENLGEESVYVGIDIDDKSHLETKPNIHTIRSRSENYTLIEEKFLGIGIENVDFLFIDGWHSVNQVIDEFWYVDRWMKSGGVIGFHDTNFHPGPNSVIKTLNPNIFKTFTFCESEEDWGIGFAIIL